MSNDVARRVAEQIAQRVGMKTRKRRLRVVGDDSPPVLSALQRDVLYSRIRDLGNMYRMNWLVRQETMHVFGVVECLTDDELTALLAMVERGVEARLDGVAFEEVGLVRGVTNNWIA